MATFIIQNDGLLDRFANMLAMAARPEAALQRALSHTGDKARTVVIRALVKRTGLKRKVIVKAVKVTRPWARPGGDAASLEYALTTRGGDIALKYFDPRETLQGVSAAPRGERRIFAHTFTRGGRFPNRVALKMGGAVLMREGASRLPIAPQKSGVYIPKEMAADETRIAFDLVIARDLPDRIAHELGRALGLGQEP